MRISIRPFLTAALLSLIVVVPAHAQLGGIGVPGIGGGSGGGSFGSSAKEYSVNVVTGMLNSVRGVENVQLALGNKTAAETLEATAKEIEGMKEPNSAALEHSAQAIADNPVDRTALANVKSVEGKKFLAIATKHMMVAGVYNAKAASSASTMAGQKPGPADALSAPAILEAAKVTVTSGPTTIKNTASYLSALTDFMSTNKMPAPSQAECAELAGKTDPNAKQAGTNF